MLTPITNGVHAVLAAIVLILTPGSAAFKYEKPAAATSVELIPAQSGSVPR